jgi:myosin heavy subunit
METPSTNQADQKNQNSKALLYTIIGILLALNAGLFYMWQKGGNEKESVEKKLETTSNNLKEKTVALEEAEFLLEKFRRDSAALVNNNKELNTELLSKKNEIAALVAKLRNNKNASDAEISELKLKIGELSAQLDRLQKENEELKEVNNQLNKEKEAAQEENKQLTAEKKKYKNIAQRLQAGNIRVEALKKRWITGKEATTSKAKEVEAFRTSFTLAENNVAEPGDKVIYVKVTGPEGVTLTNPGNEGGTFEFENKESKYTYKFSVAYDQESKSVPATKWRPARDLKKGKYTIELYCDGFKIGSETLDLK